MNDNQVTYAKMQDVSATSRVLGRKTAGTGDAEELTGADVTALLDLFTSLLKALAPASGGGTTNFLRADGMWAAPPGGGGTARWSLVAHWSQSITKTNIGTAFADVYNQTNSAGKKVLIDTNGKTDCRLTVNWNKVGTGTQTVEVVDDSNQVLLTKDVVSGWNDSGLVAIPAAFQNVVQPVRLRAKSTTGADDPIFEGAALYLR